MRKKVFLVDWIISSSFLLFSTFVCVLHFIIEKETVENMVYVIIVLFVLLIAHLFRPACIEFDKKSLTIYFLFGCFQKIDWDSVWKVERQHLPSDIHYYRVFGDSYGKKAFFTSAIIPYNRQMRRLLRAYWNENFKK